MALGNNMNFDLHISNKGKEMQEKTDELNKESVESIPSANLPTAENQTSVHTDKAAVTETTATTPDFLQTIEAQGLKVIFTPSRRKTTRRVSISIEGDFTVSTVSKLKERMTDIFGNFDYTDFILRNISQIDLAGIQLLHFITKIYSPLEKHISIDAEFSKDDKTLISNCGFTDLFSKPKLSV